MTSGTPAPNLTQGLTGSEVETREGRPAQRH